MIFECDIFNLFYSFAGKANLSHILSFQQVCTEYKYLPKSMFSSILHAMQICSESNVCNLHTRLLQIQRLQPRYTSEANLLQTLHLPNVYNIVLG